MAEPVIELAQVVKEFGREVVARVLRGIDLRVERGEFVALVGPSGSGKSTLLNIIGLLDRASFGQTKILGQDVAGLDDGALTRLRGQAIGFVFQFHHLLPALNARDNVALPSAILGGGMAPALRRRAEQELAAVGLRQRASENITRLSGGQQQRVAVARALLHRPPLILADEPTGNLDTQTAADVFGLLRERSRDHGMAVVVVTHSPDLAARCDRIVNLVDGRIVTDLRPA